MKLKPTTNHTLETNGVKQSVSFGIKESGFAHIFNVLRNQLYSDKVLAVIREYTCNAVDAMVVADKRETPIVVTLPSLLNPYFKVRDYGDALSDQEIKDVYAFYGESTKRNSNDQIGMLGIGSKAAFAYGDNFVINSFIDGKKHTHNAFIDPSQIGQISKLDVVDSDEENGIEIVVPVQEDDFKEFIDRARTLFKYFPVQPIIKGVAPFEYDTHDVLFEGEGWQWLKTDRDSRWGSSGDAMAIMGNIGYPIDSYALSLSDENSNLSSLVTENLVMTFDIGDLEISASREKLQFTDATRKEIVKRLKVVESQIIENVLSEFKNCATLMDARCLYGTIMDWSSGLYEFRGILDKKLVWKGKPITSDSFRWSHGEVDGENGTRLTHYTKSQRASRYRPEQVDTLSCTKDVVVVENDLPNGRGIVNRVLPLIFDKKKDVYVFAFKSKTAKKKVLKDTGLDCKFLLASSLEKKPLSAFYGMTTSSGGVAPSSPKHSTAAFCVDWDAIDSEADKPYYRRAKSQSVYFKCEKVDLANSSGLYVMIDRFLVKKGDDEVDPMELSRVKAALKVVGLEVPSKIYAFKAKMADKVAKNKKMINLWEWAASDFKAEVKSQDFVQRLTDRIEAKRILDLRQRWINRSVWKNQQIDISFDSDYAVFFRSLDEMLKEGNVVSKKLDTLENSTHLICGKTLKELFGEVKPSINLQGLLNKVEKKYSMLLFVDGYSYGDNKNYQPVTDYINAIDVCSL